MRRPAATHIFCVESTTVRVRTCNKCWWDIYEIRKFTNSIHSCQNDSSEKKRERMAWQNEFMHDVMMMTAENDCEHFQCDHMRFIRRTIVAICLASSALTRFVLLIRIIVRMSVCVLDVPIMCPANLAVVLVVAESIVEFNCVRSHPLCDDGDADEFQFQLFIDWIGSQH